MLRLHVKAVIFDMDGVITNTMPDHYRSWKAVLAPRGIPATYHDIYSREGQPGLQSVKELLEQYGKSFNKTQAEMILREKEEYFKKIVKQRFVLGARKFLKDLHRRGFHLAIVTGTSRHELHRILPREIYNLFKITVTGSDVKHGKPHPEPYLKSIAGLAVDAAQAVAIENAPYGIRSAKVAGLKCLALETSLPKKYLREADAVFASIKELRQRVLLNGGMRANPPEKS